GRFVFVPASHLGVYAGCVVMEAAGPAGVLRCVEFDPSEPEVIMDAPARPSPIVVEGVLVVRRHPAQGGSPAVKEVLVREARRVVRRSQGRDGDAAVSNSPPVDESFDRLHKAGWSVGEVATSAGWLVTGTNGENRLEVFGPTQRAAWWRACDAARAVGMLAG